MFHLSAMTMRQQSVLDDTPCPPCETDLTGSFSLADKLDVLVMGGDGVGPELAAAQTRVLEWFRDAGHVDCEVHETSFGLETYARHGSLIEPGGAQVLAKSDAILFGAIGTIADYASVPEQDRREWGMVRIRRELGAIANIRPARSYPESAGISPLRPELVSGADIVLVRELSGGLYVGEPRGVEQFGEGEKRAYNTQVYTSSQVRRAARIAFEMARHRRGLVTSIDKALVLETSQLWRAEVEALQLAEYADVELNHMTVDDCARELIVNPLQFDVVLADNVFGDILTDCAVPIAGVASMVASASITEPKDGRRRGLYESMSGSMMTLAGRDEANPLGAVLALGLAFEQTFGRPDLRHLLDAAVANTLASGVRPADLAGPGEDVSATSKVVEQVIRELNRPA